jgi:hypothetical protein
MYNKKTSALKIELKFLVVMFMKQVKIFFDDFYIIKYFFFPYSKFYMSTIVVIGSATSLVKLFGK